ncbi:MAG: hypothetical protein SNI70_12225 [Rikenellaceae bacterium]
MEGISICYIIVGVLVILNVVMICIAVKCAHRVPDDFEFYDKDGNHIYYDRKLIRHNRNKSNS